jgi:GH35 family endo-1,4-beta-xylanase
MLQACLNNTGVCTAFNTWGFTDKFSWETWCGKYPGCQALPFDHNYTAKLAANEMIAVLERHAAVSG